MHPNLEFCLLSHNIRLRVRSNNGIDYLREGERKRGVDESDSERE